MGLRGTLAAFLNLSASDLIYRIEMSVAASVSVYLRVHPLGWFVADRKVATFAQLSEGLDLLASSPPHLEGEHAAVRH